MKKVVIDSIEFEDFSGVRKCLKKYLFNPLINYVLPPEFLKKVLRGSKSDLAKESLVSPGSWKSMQISYDNESPKDFIDKIVLQLGSFPVGLRNRHKIVVAKMSDLIKRYKDKEMILIVGIGAGRAFNAMKAMKESGLGNVSGYFVDIDDAAFEPGKQIAKSLGLADKVKYIKGDAKNLGDMLPKEADILKLIGIIEYLDDEQVLNILKIGYKNLCKGGTVITHSIQPTHGIDPFLRNVFGLYLKYRTVEDVKGLLKKSGFSIIDVTPEPLGIYEVIRAEKK
ncbi:MAG: class I SAM-dependent methyltransferase family protein [Candidatus Auribacterota bacterium]|jgi:SAM-dependent methyltransferase|nr:class I SAM-dependent methyltransferase family protein [Candidatus Auribacterota bacterium]